MSGFARSPSTCQRGELPQSIVFLVAKCAQEFEINDLAFGGVAASQGEAGVPADWSRPFWCWIPNDFHAMKGALSNSCAARGTAGGVEQMSAKI